MNTEKALFTLQEAAEYLAISPRKLWGLTNAGHIRTTLVPPRSVRYHRKDLNGFIRRCKEGEILEQSIDQVAPTP